MSSSASDIEAGAAHVPLGEKAAGAADASPTAVAHRAKRQEAAALLALWSALVLTEGTVRFVLAAPAGDLFPADRPASVAPPFLPFLASLMECVFGLTGVLVGVGGAFFNLHNRAVTVAFLISQTVMSWFVFIVYVFLLPSYRAHFLTAPIMQFDSVGASRAFITMGILTSAAICLALQGGQFTFGMRLLVHQGEPGKASRTAGAEGRGLFWNGNMVFAGLSTAVAGILLLANGAGAGRVATGIFGAPPHVGVFPLMTLLTGLSMVATGAWGWRRRARRRCCAPSWPSLSPTTCSCIATLRSCKLGPSARPGPPTASRLSQRPRAADGPHWALLCSGGAKGAGRGGSVAH
eukprot:TRINITY_DN2994_c0_g1_i4.p1 TRINITY_DN2994_c0_g1~~TRINITY_DN2994_c0_g1_i4.p1  ORF type:complete len:407 (-),score=86.90 TRINITY_DN2994_c0_g1_i4:96-1145(-)